MRRLLVVAAITVLCVAPTACSSSGGSADSTSGRPIVSTDASGGSASRTATDSGSNSGSGPLARRLLTVKDLPSGWHMVGSVRTSPPPTDSSSSKSNCLNGFGAGNVKPKQQARVDFAKGSAGVPIANLAVGQFGDSQAKPAFKRISTAFSACHEITDRQQRGGHHRHAQEAEHRQAR